MTFRFRAWMLSGALALAGLQGIKAADVELFGGYSSGRMKPSNEALRDTMSGWNASVTAYATRRLGFTADFAGFYGAVSGAAVMSDGSVSSNAGQSISTRQYSFMAGPQIRLLHKGRLETSFRALAGGAYGYIPGPAYSSADQTSFAALIGSNIDIRVSRRVSMRFSPGMYITQFGVDQTQKNFRFSVGPVFHFGGES